MKTTLEKLRMLEKLILSDNPDIAVKLKADVYVDKYENTHVALWTPFGGIRLILHTADTKCAFINYQTIETEHGVAVTHFHDSEKICGSFFDVLYGPKWRSI